MMKRILLYTFFAIISLIGFIACGAQKTAAEKEAQAAAIRNAMETFEFRFDATRALPTGFRTVNLSPVFDVRVSPDTVQVNLPFFGRAFRAPMNPSESPYRFTSTNFDYNVTSGRRAGNWLVQITFKDVHRQVIFNFDIWENGSASLNIRDIDRQSISFQGNIEAED
jgi:hypothetical protein